ncbi:MAG: LptF/LptG family permease [Verrucomicrobia bacterium]|nr:LptF/LptG family permease [Verrucomicrobiota bacterium]MBS0647479.1 LptF/LptG family permease [Verrucomicrobiota bacterium]
MIYKHYLFRQISKLFFFFLSATVFLLIIFDLSARANLFRQPHMHFGIILLYELTQLMKLLNHLVCFVLLLCTVTLCTQLTRTRELIVLTTGGISKRSVLHPLLAFAVLVMTALYFNGQWIAPKANAWNHNFRSTYLKQQTAPTVSMLSLPQDDSELIYANYNAKQNTLEDVYWLKNSSTIWHMKYLDLKNHQGYFVDKLTKTNKGWKRVTSVASTESLPISLDNKALKSKILPLTSQSLSQLSHQTSLSVHKVPDRIAKTTAYFLQQLTLPLACLFAVLIPAPFCLHFSRQMPVYMLFFWTLLGGICYLVIVNTSSILGGSQLLAPVVAICVPPALLTIFSLWNYARLQ